MDTEFHALFGECHRRAVGTEALGPAYDQPDRDRRGSDGASARPRSYRSCTRHDSELHRGHLATSVRARVQNVTTPSSREIDSPTTPD